MPGPGGRDPPDGRLAVPEDVRTAGWWRGGSRVGDPFGAVLVAGHVDSRTQGLGPYAELLTVRRGQEVVVGTATLRQRYRIRSLRLVPQGPLAARPSLHSPRGPRRLVLVTCAPPYDAARGGYQHLAVVTAYPGRPPDSDGARDVGQEAAATAGAAEAPGRAPPGEWPACPARRGDPDPPTAPAPTRPPAAPRRRRPWRRREC